MEQEQRIQQLWQRGLNYLRLGNLAAAQACFEGILVRDSGHVQAHLKLAVVQLNRGSVKSALIHAEQAHSLAPSDFEALAFLAKILLLTGRVARARALALSAQPGPNESAAALDALGGVLSQLGEHRRAIERFDASLSVPPFSAEQYFNRALAHRAASQMVPFENDLDSCLALDPGQVKAHWHLAQLHRRGRGAAHVEVLRRLLEVRPIGSAEHEVLALTLFRELDGLDRFADAWSALESALVDRSMQPAHEPVQWSAFRNLLTQPLPAPTSARGPIFIVGLPQSGVAVLGRLIERHPEVLNLGSAPSFARRLNAAMAQTLGETSRWQLSDAEATMAGLDFSALGQDYSDSVGCDAGSEVLTCECVPTNALLIGAIARALPQARFLHVTRDAKDNALSLLAMPRVEAGLANENLTSLIEDLNRHRDLMQHWQANLPGRVMDVQYESLVRKPEMVLRVVCAFLGLRFTSNLDAHDLQERRIGRSHAYADRLVLVED